MADTIVINAELREDVGKGASRRLRKHADKVPGIMYGGGGQAVPLVMGLRELTKAMQEEAFFSQILQITVAGESQQAVVRDLQRNPSSDRVTHVDFMRVSADKELQVSVPLHFVDEEKCVGVRLGGGSIAHNLMEVEISCLPRNLPEFIAVYMAELNIGDSVHLSDLALPEGVEIPELALGEDHDITVVSVHAPRIVSDEELEAEGAEEAPREEPEDEATDEAGDDE